MHISSSRNSHVKLARSLLRRRNRQASGLCLIEGLRLVQDAWQAGIRPQTLFLVAESPENHQPSQGLVSEMVAQGVEVLTCTTDVFATFAGTVTPQGIAAIVPMPKPDFPPHPDWVVLLDQVRDPGNAGTLLRSAAAAGAGLVLFGPQTVDPYNDKVLRAAMGAHFRIPLYVHSRWHDIQPLLEPQHRIYLAEAGAPLLYDQVDWTEPVVLAIGGEASGASPALRAIATPVAIPMQRHTESLNAAVAGSVILFEIARQRRQARHSREYSGTVGGLP